MFTWEERKGLMWLWSWRLAALIGSFWLICYLGYGQVPQANIFTFDGRWIYRMPIFQSRFWDILIGPVWSCLFLFLLTGNRISKDGFFFMSMVIGALLGFFVGLEAIVNANRNLDLLRGVYFGLNTSLALSLMLVLECGLLYGSIFGVMSHLNKDQHLGRFGLSLCCIGGLGYGLGISFAAGLGCSVVYGLVVGLAVTLGFELAVSLLFGLSFGLTIGLISIYGKLKFRRRRFSGE